MKGEGEAVGPGSEMSFAGGSSYRYLIFAGVLLLVEGEMRRDRGRINGAKAPARRPGGLHVVG